MSILEVDNLSISFIQYAGRLKQKTEQVITDVSIELEAGQILAVAGASGSGKSLLAHAILGILPANAKSSGRITYNGEVLTKKSQEKLSGREIVLVPQSVSFLDPLMRVGAQVRSSVRSGNAKEIQRRVFERYQLKEEVERMYPFELSGGMARRVLVATAMVSGANVVIADEPTPGLDAVVLEETLDNLREFANQGCAVMLISHDIEAALKIADKVAVFYEGTVIEVAPAAYFSGKGERLCHPYSQALWRALPQNDFTPLVSTPASPDDSKK